MMTKRRPGGQPGNLNRARKPWNSLWSRRARAPKHRWVRAVVQDYIAGLTGDKPDATAVEQRIMEIAATARACQSLILAEARESGVLREESLVKFQAVELRGLALLGAERRQVDVLTLEDYVSAASEKTEAAGQ
jgi:hypothetical protein